MKRVFVLAALLATSAFSMAQVQIGKGVQIGFGASGALFPGSNGLVFNTSTVASRNATFSDIVPLWASGSCSGFLKSDGTCSTPAGASFPGSNGVVFNTSTSASRNATFSDIVPLWGSGSCSGFLKNDGTCGAGGSPSVGAAGTIQAADGSGAFASATSLNIQNGIGAGVYDAFGAAGMAGTTILVAASNSPNKAIANVICTGTNDGACINGAIATACPSSTLTNVVGCNVRLEDGIYHLETSLVFNTDGWNLTGMGHGMWGGYNHAWNQNTPTVTAWNITSNVACFTAANTFTTGAEVVMIGFGTSTFFNNYTSNVLSSGLSTSQFCIPFTHANGSATEAGNYISPTGSIGNGGSQLRATGPGFPLIQVTHTTSCGTGSDSVRCRGWKVNNIYGVCYGYSGDFLDVTSAGSGDDNIMVDDNVMQRCKNGVDGSFDSPTLKDNSFQDNTGSFFVGGGLYIKGQNNLIYDDGGYAYTGIFSRGGNLSDRAWGDLLGGFFGGCNICDIHDTPVFQTTTGVTLGGYNNTVSGMSFNSLSGTCVTITGNNIGGGFSPAQSYANTITGNSCYSSGFTLQQDAIAMTNANGGAITGNTIVPNVASPTAMQPGQAVNAGTCTACTVTGNNAYGEWNYGGAPITIGTNSIMTGNIANTFSANGIVPITSAWLLGRFQATNATPATNGSTITAWTDSSGLGYNVSVFYGTPTYTTSSPINSLPAIDFNGTNAGAYAPVVASSVNQARSVWVVFNQTAAGSSGTTPTLWGSGNAGLNTTYFNGTSNVLCVYSGSIFCSTIAPTTTATHVLEVVINGSSSRLVVDGTSVATFTAGPTSSGVGMTMGNKQNIANNFFNGYIAEEAYYNGANSTADAQTLGAAYCSAFAVSCGTSW